MAVEPFAFSSAAGEVDQDRRPDPRHPFDYDDHLVNTATSYWPIKKGTRRKETQFETSSLDKNSIYRNNE